MAFFRVETDRKLPWMGTIDQPAHDGAYGGVIGRSGRKRLSGFLQTSRRDVQVISFAKSDPGEDHAQKRAGIVPQAGQNQQNFFPKLGPRAAAEGGGDFF